MWIYHFEILRATFMIRDIMVHVVLIKMKTIFGRVLAIHTFVIKMLFDIPKIIQIHEVDLTDRRCMKQDVIIKIPCVGCHADYPTLVIVVIRVIVKFVTAASRTVLFINQITVIIIQEEIRHYVIKCARVIDSCIINAVTILKQKYVNKCLKYIHSK